MKSDPTAGAGIGILRILETRAAAELERGGESGPEGFIALGSWPNAPRSGASRRPFTALEAGVGKLKGKGIEDRIVVKNVVTGK